MLAEKIDGPANIAGATSPASDALHANYLALLGLPDNHTGFAAIALTVLAVTERNAVPLMSGSMTTEEFVQSRQKGPDDVARVGFDGIAKALLGRTRITAVALPLRQLPVAGFNAIDGRCASDDPHEPLRGRLVPRKACGCHRP